jgi:hypothetical protein
MKLRLSLLVASVALVVLAAGSDRAAAETVWLCKPKLAENPCRDSLETTVYDSWTHTHVENPPFAKRPKVDCFYVYPTVSGQEGPNADKSIEEEQIAIAKYQASRFSQRCRVFAPIYRQLTLSALGSDVDPAAAELAYSDVRAAWRDYLRRYNRGRPVVLIGHSQGTGMLRALISREIDDDREARRLLVSAILLGGDVTVRAGKRRGGDFDRIPTCRSARQFKCVIAYSTYNEPPPDDSRFGRPDSRFSQFFGLPQGPGYSVACTNPAALGGGSAPVQTYTRTEPFPGAIGVALVIMYGGVVPVAPTPWVDPPGYYMGECVESNGAHVLMIDEAEGAPQLHPSPDDTWGLHLADVNIALGDLVALVQTQSKAYLKARR